MDTTSSPHPPSISETAFDCPHCGAYSAHSWYTLYASLIKGSKRTPLIGSAEFANKVESDVTLKKEYKEVLLQRLQRTMSGRVQIESRDIGTYLSDEVLNVNISQCFNCNAISVWRHTSLIFPPKKIGPTAHKDMPEEIRADFEEARSIVNLSPRGASALLRLCIQKLCAYLGEGQRDINAAIAALVAKGLHPTVQKSLDIVRVIGNEAVHPGLLDIKDDTSTALELFELVNFIVDDRISRPKKIDGIYNTLPEAKRQQIEKRDGKSTDH